MPRHNRRSCRSTILTGWPGGRAVTRSDAYLLGRSEAEPERIVAEVAALVRPGGMIASQEADFVGHLCDPPLAAWTRLLDAYHAYARARGIDLHIGRRTHRLFRDAGIVDIRVDPMVRAL